MDERDANIDLVFRNGFRNLEVLPPADAWDTIKPVIGRKHRNAMVLRRAAATVALIIAVSALMYTWNDENPSLSFNRARLNQEVVPLVEILPENSSGTIIIPINDNLIAVAMSESSRIPETGVEQIRKIQYSPSLTESGSNEDLQRPSPGTASGIPASYFFVEDPLLNTSPETKTVKMADRWSVSALASPTYFSRLNLGGNDLTRQMIASEQPMMSYSGGLALTYKINKRVSVQSGLFYSSVGQQINGISSYGGFRQYDNTKGSRNFEVMTSSGIIYTSNADVFLRDESSSRIMTHFTSDVFDPEKASLEPLNNSLKQNYSYLELPVFLRYKLIDKILDINLIGGLSYNFLIDNSVYTTNQGNRYTIGKTEGLNMMTFSSSLGMGMEYAFTRNISLNLEPTFRYYMNPFRSVQESVIHPYSFGVFSGVTFKF